MVTGMTENKRKSIKEIIEEYADCREEMDIDKCVTEIGEELKRKELEGYLWAIKEASWKLYANAYWKPGIKRTVEQICQAVNNQLIGLGLDPVVRIK